jgi:hypothetical protein
MKRKEINKCDEALAVMHMIEALGIDVDSLGDDFLAIKLKILDVIDSHELPNPTEASNIVKEISYEGLCNVVRNAGYIGMYGQTKQELQIFVQHLLETDAIDEIELLIEMQGE